jgi:hypothetical protein
MTDFYASTMLAVRKVQEDTGLTMDEILALPADEYARLTGRETPSQVAARVAAELYPQPAQPQVPVTKSHSAESALLPGPESPGVDAASLDMQAYSAFRHQIGLDKAGQDQGIFGSTGSQSETYRSAAHAHSGRTALSNTNVTEAPKLTGRYVRQDDHRDTRSAAERFGTPGNSFQV